MEEEKCDHIVHSANGEVVEIKEEERNNDIVPSNDT